MNTDSSHQRREVKQAINLLVTDLPVLEDLPGTNFVADLTPGPRSVVRDYLADGEA